MLKRLICALVVLLVLPVSVFAHPGRTDGSGGHTDRETGDYHYHHGYEAHYHTGGVCPFEFDDKTGWNSGEPSGSSGSSNQEVPDVEWVQIADGWWHNPDLDQWKDSEGNLYTGIEYYEALGYTYHEDIGIWTGADGIINEEGLFQSYDDIAAEIEAAEGEHDGQPLEDPEPVTEPEAPEEESTHGIFGMPVELGVMLLLLAMPAVFIVIGIVSEISDWIRNRKTRKIRFAEKQAHYRDLYEGKTREEVARMCGMPDMVWIGEDGLPKGPSLLFWGEEYTFYISRTGQSFHGKASCNKHATIPCHASRLGARTPCARCRPNKPNLSWYYKYLGEMACIETYKVTLSDGK